MTANQIAYQSNIETERHNRVTEQEAERHNVEQEGIQKRANELDSWRIQVDDNYKRTSNRIQEEYNRAYINLQQAQGDRKLDIEEYLAELRRKQQDNELFYQTQRNQIQMEANVIARDRAVEEERHNKEMEQYQNTYMDRNFALENRKAEYMATYYRDLITFHNAELAFKRNDSLRNYLLESEYKANQISLIAEQAITEQKKQENLEADTKLKGSQNVSEGFHILFDGVDTVINGATKLAPLFMQ